MKLCACLRNTPIDENERLFCDSHVKWAFILGMGLGMCLGMFVYIIIFLFIKVNLCQ